MFSIANIFCALFLLVASFFDTKTRKIPNILNIIGVIIGFAINYNNFFNTFIGFLYGFVLGYILFMMGTMGAGDGKMFAAVGAIVGIDVLFRSLIISLIIFLAYVLLENRKKFKDFFEYEKNALLSLFLRVKPVDNGKRSAFAPFLFIGFVIYQISQVWR
ncbi:A24 family peptidase [Thermoanaerobacterium thermosaccharolyticum]|uniref:A24 family peptidase n=1 Tax=Thermoanaerobacterium thermosaccharolyticum TaxID=1517 RepID=UPI002FD8D730